jgi:glycerophosphoryl diester phosphodiesterase
LNANVCHQSTQWKFVNFFGEVVSVVGHRGWPTRFPDNTVAGFQAAFEVVSMVETDIRRAAGGELVLSHDAHLGGLTVAETRWEDLRMIDLGGTGPASLAEALAACPDGRWNLEIKNDPLDPGYEDDLAIAMETAELAGPGDLCTSFFWPNVDLIRDRLPEVRTGLLVDEGWDVSEAAHHAREKGHIALAVHWSILERDPGEIRRLAGLGLATVTWTVNDSAIALRLVEAGVAAIITDDPGMISEALR